MNKTQSKKFRALVVADIEEESFHIKTDVLDANTDPVYENGLKFTGEVVVTGMVSLDTDTKTLSKLLTSYLREYVEFVRVRKIEIDGVSEASANQPAKKVVDSRRRAC